MRVTRFDRAACWGIAFFGILVNVLYFAYEYAQGGLLEHFSDIWMEHFLILGIIPLTLGAAVLSNRNIRLNSVLEDKVRERTRELEAVNHLKDLFSDILTHDLINPLGSARNAVELKLMDGPDDDVLGLAKRNLDRSIELILLAHNYSKITGKKELDLEELNLSAVIREGILDFKEEADEKGMRIEYNGPKEALLRANPIIGEVFINLLSNALKFGKEGTLVMVGLKKEGDKWRSSVSNVGPCIKDEDKIEVFKRFNRRAKGGVKGSGLGLAIVHKILVLHKGRVWVEDLPGGGCVFKLEIPGS